ncbi:hypothetical protein LCGC14_1267570 [marine sediment metagenome]|uniref:Uncharacterized protein n=1 Tax=marine sediment metagenome TaxID=412755 RepID=A0A0F9P271_9ZZZZ
MTLGLAKDATDLRLSQVIISEIPKLENYAKIAICEI